MDSQEFRRRGREVIDFIVEYYRTCSERRIMNTQKEGYLRELLPESAPMVAESFDKIMEDVKNHIMPGIVHWTHPRYFAYFPCGGCYSSILADMLISTVNCAGFSWAAGPACTELEIITLDWLAKMIGLPEEFLSTSRSGGGVFQVSAPDAILVTMIAARHYKTKELNRRNPTLDRRTHLPFYMAYCSQISHSCIVKVAEVAMVQVRLLEVDEKRRLRGKTLAKAMAEDKARGIIPFFVFTSMGSTGCCSCDALDEIGPVCEEHGVWLHVDAAYAGSAFICPEFQYLLEGVQFAESISIEPSMWMLMNFDCCALWIQNRWKLTEALIVDPVYLQHAHSENSIDYRHWGVPLSRRFRALKLWFVLRNYGVEGLQSYIRKHISLAKIFGDFIKKDDRFVLENEVRFGIVCFRLKGSNALNVTLLSRINASDKMFLVGVLVECQYVLRFCICSENVEEDDVIFACETVSEIAGQVLSEKEYKEAL